MDSRPAFARWFWRWVTIVSLGELVGFALPVTVGVLTVDSPWAYPLLLVAGAVEGALLAAAQVLALRGRLSLRGGRWIVLTALAAVVAYAIGLLPSTFASVWTVWPVIVQIAVFGVLGLALLLSIGGAQWPELRHHVEKAWWWIIGTALGWLVGLAVFFVIVTPLWQEGQPFLLTAAIGLFAGLLMAVAMASVTGATMISVLRRDRSGIRRQTD